MRIKKKQVSLGIVYFMFFLIGLAFFGRSYELAYILFIYMLLNKKMSTTKIGLILFLLGLLISISSIINYNDNPFIMVLKGFIYWAFFHIGFSFGCDSKDEIINMENKVYYTLFSFSLGCWLRYVIDVLISWTTVLHHHRWITDLWTHAETTATIGAGWCIPLSCIFYYTIVNKDVSRTLKITTILQVIIALFFNILTGTRTFLFILVLTTAVEYLFHKIKIKNDKKNAAKFVRLIVIAGATCIFAYCANIGSLRDVIQKSTLLMRISEGELSSSALDSNGRTDRILYAMRNIDKIWFGGSFCENTGNRIHNWIFQGLDLYGVIPAIILVFILIYYIRKFIWVISSLQFSANFKLLIFGTFTTCICYSMVEPIFTSNNIVMGVFFAIAGILSNSRKVCVK